MDPGLAVGARPIAEIRGLVASETPLAPIVIAPPMPQPFVTCA